MSNKHLLTRPIDLTSSCWMYEDSKGLLIVHEIKKNDEYIRTDQIVIPIDKIRKYLERKDRQS